MESDEVLYLRATQEAEGANRNEAIWAKSMALAEGDEKRAKYNYIKLRVGQLKRSSIRNPLSTHEEFKETQPKFKEESDFHNNYISVSEYSKLHDIPCQLVRKQLEDGDLRGAVKDRIQYVLHTGIIKSPENQVRTDIENEYISVSEYAKLHNITEKTVYVLLENNELLGKTANGQQYIHRSCIVKQNQKVETVKTSHQSGIEHNQNSNYEHQNTRSKNHESKGIGRLAYFLWIIVAFVIAAFTNIFSRELGTLIMLTIWIIATIFRFKNIGMNPYLAFIGLIPIVSLIIYWRALTFPPNYHQHKTIDFAGRFAQALYITFWLSVLIVFAYL